MKDLSSIDLLNAPSKVQFVYLMSIAKQPIGSSMYEEVLKEYPEYFPEEVEHRRKYDLIPKSVHDEYFKEYWEMHTKVFERLPKSKGIMSMINNDGTYEEWKRIWDECREIEKPLEKALHEKYYSKYWI